MKTHDRKTNTIVTEPQIIDMFWSRDELVLQTVDTQYRKLILSVCSSVLYNYEDSEECLNTVYLKLWNSIPPEKPRSLKAYIIRIARFVSLDRFRADHRKKHINSSLIEALDDFSDFLTDDYSIEEELLNGELNVALNEFVRDLPSEQQSIFIKRYYYSQSVKAISEDDKITIWQVKKKHT